MIPILNMSDAAALRARLMNRSQLQNEEISRRVKEIVARVREEGDAALLAYCKKFDGADMDTLLVTPAEMEEALTKVDPKFIAILERAAANIRKFHEKQVRNGFAITEKEGIILGQKITPIEKAGLYVPGGSASYPSSVLMNAIPAKIAGSEKIVI